MHQTVREVMTPNPEVLDVKACVADAARVMRDKSIGDVMVSSDGKVCGIVTDRDITVRVVAEGMAPEEVMLGDVCSRELVSLTPDDPVEEAIRLMRDEAIRRIAVCDEGGRPVGVVSIGDLALERDRDSALADISAAPANA